MTVAGRSRGVEVVGHMDTASGPESIFALAFALSAEILPVTRPSMSTSTRTRITLAKPNLRHWFHCLFASSHRVPPPAPIPNPGHPVRPPAPAGPARLLSRADRAHAATFIHRVAQVRHGGMCWGNTGGSIAHSVRV